MPLGTGNTCRRQWRQEKCHNSVRQGRGLLTLNLGLVRPSVQTHCETHEKTNFLQWPCAWVWLSCAGCRTSLRKQSGLLLFGSGHGWGLSELLSFKVTPAFSQLPTAARANQCYGHYPTHDLLCWGSDASSHYTRSLPPVNFPYTRSTSFTTVLCWKRRAKEL